MNSLACYYGNELFSLGPSTEVGANNDTACDLDFQMRNCSLLLVGKTVAKDGRIGSTRYALRILALRNH